MRHITFLKVWDFCWSLTTFTHALPSPVVMSTLGQFANITLSSLYFDIMKDCLYANSITSIERRSVITVLEQVGSLSFSTADIKHSSDLEHDDGNIRAHPSTPCRRSPRDALPRVSGLILLKRMETAGKASHLHTHHQPRFIEAVL